MIGVEHDALSKRIEIIFRQITAAKARVAGYKHSYKLLEEKIRKVC